MFTAIISTGVSTVGNYLASFWHFQSNAVFSVPLIFHQQFNSVYTVTSSLLALSETSSHTVQSMFGKKKLSPSCNTATRLLPGAAADILHAGNTYTFFSLIPIICTRPGRSSVHTEFPSLLLSFSHGKNRTFLLDHNLSQTPAVSVSNKVMRTVCGIVSHTTKEGVANPLEQVSLVQKSNSFLSSNKLKKKSLYLTVYYLFFLSFLPHHYAASNMHRETKQLFLIS